MIYGQIFSFNFLGDRKKSFRLPGGGGQREEKLWRKGKKWNIIIYHVQSHFVSVATYSEYTFTRHLTRRKTNKSKPVNPFPVYVGLFRKKSQLHIQWQRMFGLGRKKTSVHKAYLFLCELCPYSSYPQIDLISLIILFAMSKRNGRLLFMLLSLRKPLKTVWHTIFYRIFLNNQISTRNSPIFRECVDF